MTTMRLEICRKVGFCAAWTTVLSFACFVSHFRVLSMCDTERHMSDIDLGLAKTRGPII